MGAAGGLDRTEWGGQGWGEPEGKREERGRRATRSTAVPPTMSGAPPSWLAPPCSLQDGVPRHPDTNLGKCLFPRCPTQRAVNVSWNLSKISRVTKTGVSLSTTRIEW